MNKRILLSSLSIVASLALATGATFAFFSDSGTSSNNSFAAGSFDLLLSEAGGETDQDNVTQTWVGTNMVPGVTTVDATLKLKNGGTVPGDNVHVALVNDLTGSPAPDQIDDYLEIVTLEYDSVNILPLVTESGNNAFMDLADWAALAGTHSIPGSIQLDLSDTSVDHNLHMVVRLHSSAPNGVEGESMTSIFTATLHQGVGQ